MEKTVHWKYCSETLRVKFHNVSSHANIMNGARVQSVLTSPCNAHCNTKFNQWVKQTSSSWHWLQNSQISSLNRELLHTTQKWGSPQFSSPSHIAEVPNTHLGYEDLLQQLTKLRKQFTHQNIYLLQKCLSTQDLNSRPFWWVFCWGDPGGWCSITAPLPSKLPWRYVMS